MELSTQLQICLSVASPEFEPISSNRGKCRNRTASLRIEARLGVFMPLKDQMPLSQRAWRKCHSSRGRYGGDISDIKFAQRFKAGPRSIWLNETSKAHPFELKTAAGDESQAKLCPDPDLPEAPPSL